MAIHIFLNPAEGIFYPVDISKDNIRTYKTLIGHEELGFAYYKIEGIAYELILYDFSALVPEEIRYPSVRNNAGENYLYGNIIISANDEGGVTRDMEQEEVVFIMDHIKTFDCLYTPSRKTAVLYVDD